MTSGQFSNDLVVLVADKNMEFAVKGILSRVNALKIREMTATFHVHPENDPGCRLRGHLFLRLFVNQFAHALVILDRDGSGKDNSSREALEAQIEEQLSESGWGQRAAAIVIDPELEMWVWSNSLHVDSILGWEGRNPSLRNWLQERAFIDNGQIKPCRPKEALDTALRSAKKPRSSSLYMQLAQKVSLERCVDPAFVKLRSVLQIWFPSE